MEFNPEKILLNVFVFSALDLVGGLQVFAFENPNLNLKKQKN